MTLKTLSDYEGAKAKYNHARIIATSLMVEIGRELKTYYTL